MVRVVSLDSIWEDELRERLDPSIEFVTARREANVDRDAALAQADVVITVVFDKDMARVAKSLRLVICPAAGTEHIDRSALAQNVRLINGIGHEIPIAEYVIGALVSLRRHFSEADQALRRGEWVYGFHKAERLLEELHGSNLGLLGFGRIGQEIAKRAASFGMRCAAVTLHPHKHIDMTTELAWLGQLSDQHEVDKLAAWSDALVVCCELSPQTEGLLHAGRFDLMKRSAIVVNVARGAIAVEADLFEALHSRRIAGAAIDVWYQYPHRSQHHAAPSQYPFHELDNVLMTPHCSGWTEGNKQRRLAWMAQAINDFASGVLSAR